MTKSDVMRKISQANTSENFLQPPFKKKKENCIQSQMWIWASIVVDRETDRQKGISIFYHTQEAHN